VDRLQAGKKLLCAEVTQGVAAFELDRVRGHYGGLWWWCRAPGSAKREAGERREGGVAAKAGF